MPTLEAIQNQIKSKKDFSHFLTRKEIKELPNILWDDEEVENLLIGTYNAGNGVLVATNRRLVFVDKGFLYGLKVEDFPYEKISSIQYETGLLLGKLTIFTSGNKAIIDNTQKKEVRAFGDWVRARISAPRANQIKEPTTVSDSSNDQIIEKLERLGKLKESGVIDEEEFKQQKNRILNSL